MQGRGFPILDVHADLRVARARQVEAQRADAGKPAVALADRARDRTGRLDVGVDEVHVERDQRAAGADDDATRRRMQLRRPEVGRELARLDPVLQLLRASSSEKRRASSLPHLGVEEDRKAELVADAARDLARARASPFRVRRSDRHDGNDVRSADARVHAFVRAQVDRVSRTRNAGEQRIGDRVLVADEGEHGPVVVGVDVHVEHACVRREPGADGVDDGAVAAFGEVRDALEREHAQRLRAQVGRAVLADLGRDEPQSHTEVERLAPDTKAEAGLERREERDHARESESRRVLAGRVPEEARGHREDGADRLGETLGRPRRVAVAQVQARRDEARRDERKRAELRPGERPGDEPVGEHRQDPTLLECDRRHGQHGDDARDEPCGCFVDRVRKREETAHDHP